MTAPVQFVLLLDIDGPADRDGVLQHVPDRRAARHVLRLSDFGDVTSRGWQPRDQLDWVRIETALVSLIARVHADWPTDGAPVAVYVGGGAPLAVFFALGVAFDARQARLVTIQVRRNAPGVWDVLDLTQPVDGAPLLTEGGLSTPSEGDGNVAAFFSTQQAEPPREKLRQAMAAVGDHLLGVAHLTTPAPVTVDETNIGRLVKQLADYFVGITRMYPHRSGLTAFPAGPSFLALAAGLAINPNQFLGDGHSIRVAEFVGGSYKPVLTLPLTAAPQIAVPQDAASLLRRREAFDHFKTG